MKNALIYLILPCYILIAGCSSGKNTKDAPPFEHFQISFEQDGMPVPVINRTVQLKKSPFSIIVRFPVPDGIFINTSFDSETLDEILLGLPLQEIQGFQGNSINEELYNRDEALIVSKSSPGFWHYTGDNEHNFSSVTEQNGIITCTRNISRIYDPDTMESPLPVEKIKENEIYISIMKMEWTDDYSKRIEKKRDYYTVRFLSSN